MPGLRRPYRSAFAGRSTSHGTADIKLLLESLGWTVAILPFTLLYYAVVLSLLVLLGLTWLICWPVRISNRPTRIRRREPGRQHAPKTASWDERRAASQAVGEAWRARRHEGGAQ
jgi:hypothetical protein